MRSNLSDREKAILQIRKMQSVVLDQKRKYYNAEFKRIALTELKKRGYIKSKTSPKKINNMWSTGGW